MVLVNNIKYACGTCIKGHRSSTCKHSDRPLFEIKKKGRPVTQCEHCRELRKTKQVHVKCVCEVKDGGDAGGSDSGCSKAALSKTLEKPAFPNGLPEAMGASVALQVAKDGSSAEPERKEKSHSGCKSGSQCDCCAPRTTKSKIKMPKPIRSSNLPATDVSDPQYPNHSPSTSPTSRMQDTEYNPFDVAGPVHDPSMSHTARVRHHTSEYRPYGKAYDHYAHLHGHPSVGRPSSVQHLGGTANTSMTPPPMSFGTAGANWLEPSIFCSSQTGYDGHLPEMNTNMDRSRSSTGSTNSAGFSQDVPSYQMRTAGSDIGTYASIDDWMVYSALPRQQSAASRLTASESSFWEGMGTANIDMPSSALCIDASASFGPSPCACLSGMCRCTSSVECWSAGDLAGGSQTLSDSISVLNMPDPSSMSTMSDPIPMADSISTSAMPDLMHSRSSSSSSSSGASSLQSFRDVVGAGSGGGWPSMSGSADDLFGAPVIDGLW